jgi:hypothetical protein
VDSVELSTVVYVSPEEAYDFLVDFPGYANYSEHLQKVERHGEGEVGTEYDIHLEWWKLHYVVRSEVTDTDRPERIEWRITKDLDAHGAWVVEPAPEVLPDAEAVEDAAESGAPTANGGAERPDDAGTTAEPPADAESASRVRLVIEFDADSADSDMLNLPRLVSLDWVIDKVRPLVLKEAERVVARIVADLEGDPRDVELTLHESPDTV